MVNYACAFSQSEWGKYVEWIIIIIIIIIILSILLSIIIFIYSILSETYRDQ